MRLMRARMTRGTAVVMGATAGRFGAWLRTAAGRLHPAAGPPQKLLMPGAGFAAPPGRWPTQNWGIWPSIMANQPLAMPAQTRQALSTRRYRCGDAHPSWCPVAATTATAPRSVRLHQLYDRKSGLWAIYTDMRR